MLKGNFETHLADFQETFEKNQENIRKYSLERVKQFVTKSFRLFIRPPPPLSTPGREYFAPPSRRP